MKWLKIRTSVQNGAAFVLDLGDDTGELLIRTPHSGWWYSSFCEPEYQSFDNTFSEEEAKAKVEEIVKQRRQNA